MSFSIHVDSYKLTKIRIQNTIISNISLMHPFVLKLSFSTLCHCYSWKPLICSLPLQSCLFQNVIQMNSYNNFVRLVSFAQYSAFEIHPCCCIYQQLFFVAEQYSNVWAYHSVFICVFIEGQQRLFLVIMDNVHINTHVKVFM